MLTSCNLCSAWSQHLLPFPAPHVQCVIRSLCCLPGDSQLDLSAVRHDSSFQYLSKWAELAKGAGPVLGLQLCYHNLEILNSFWANCRVIILNKKYTFLLHSLPQITQLVLQLKFFYSGLKSHPCPRESVYREALKSIKTFRLIGFKLGVPSALRLPFLVMFW